MSLDPAIRASLTLPAICAPMFLVTGPALVREACKAGVIGGLPRQNARSFEIFEQWLADIRADLDRHRAEHPEAHRSRAEEARRKDRPHRRSDCRDHSGDHNCHNAGRPAGPWDP